MKTNEFITAGLIGSGMTALVGALIFTRGKKEERRAVESLSRRFDINVDDGVLNDAVNTATNRAVKDRVDTIANRAVESVKNDISYKVSKTVKDAYSNVEQDVKSRLNDQVSSIDILGIKKEVINYAKDEITKKLISEIGGLSSLYSSSLYADSSPSIKAIEMLKERGLESCRDSEVLEYSRKIFEVGKKSLRADVAAEAYNALEELSDHTWRTSTKKQIMKYMLELV